MRFNGNLQGEAEATVPSVNITGSARTILSRFDEDLNCVNSICSLLGANHYAEDFKLISKLKISLFVSTQRRLFTPLNNSEYRSTRNHT